ncbi:MAG: hypothetical protein J5636_06870 [Clostridiales bacterium]|nr:hypothetical protein [Clostridiales bacterium]
MAGFMERFQENLKNIRDLNNKTPKPSDGIRDAFISELTQFYDNGTEPPHASQDMRYFLHQHEKRLAEKGVRIRRQFSIAPDGVRHTVSKSRPPYTADLSFIECDNITQYFEASSQKKLKKKKTCSIFYANILNRPDVQDAEYICPNCGHRATLAIFGNGCPMCGTRFQMKQIFPCVANFYLLDQVVKRNAMNWLIKTAVILAVILAISMGSYTAYSMWSDVSSPLLAVGIGVGAALLYGFIGFIVIYLTLSIFSAIFIMAHLTSQAITTADVASASLTKNALSKAMERFDPEFSYELFEGKVMSLFRAIAFSEDRTNMSIYRGDPNIEDFDNLIDIDYRGAMKYLNMHIQDNNNLVLLVRLYLFTTYYKNGKVVTKKEDFNITLVKKLTAQENYGFSIHAVNCKTCAASFDAMHVLQCPTCGTPYHLEEEDWVVYGLKR